MLRLLIAFAVACRQSTPTPIANQSTSPRPEVPFDPCSVCVDGKVCVQLIGKDCAVAKTTCKDPVTRGHWDDPCPDLQCTMSCEQAYCETVDATDADGNATNISYRCLGRPEPCGRESPRAFTCYDAFQDFGKPAP